MQCAPKHGTNTESHNGSTNQQQISNTRIAALERTAPKPPGAYVHFTGTKYLPLIMLLLKNKNC